MCDAVNEAIDVCLGAGTVRATSVMTNMPACRKAAFLRHCCPEASIGIHWTLTQGKPILDAARVSSLIDRDGNFFSLQDFRRRWIRRRIRLDEIRNELLAQYQRFCDLVGNPDFWNTHQHVHVWETLFQTFVALGLELNIPAMRCNRRILVPYDATVRSYNIRHPLFFLKGEIISAWSSRAERLGMLMPRGMIHMPGYAAGTAAIQQAATSIYWPLSSDILELMIHPATRVEEDLFGNLIEYKENRLQEYKFFGDPTVVHHLSNAGIELVGFEALMLERITNELPLRQTSRALCSPCRNLTSNEPLR
jgi:predicted glycoside hydrolase/deacetylase ChbG (UPF0249 family)